MTTILYDGLGGLHGDRHRGPHRSEGTKVRRVKGGLIGTAGDTGDCLRLERFIDEMGGRHPRQWPELPKAESLMAIYVHRDGAVFLIDLSRFPIPQDRERPLAIGSGGDIALGAFVVSCNVAAAMGAAHRFDSYTGPTYDSVTLQAEESVAAPEPPTQMTLDREAFERA